MPSLNEGNDDETPIHSATARPRPCSGNAKFGTLKDTMKELGARIKTISLQVDNSSLDTQSAALADEVAMLADDSKTFVPDLIAQAPVIDQQ
ncbi:MAG: hypothetical protein IPM97_08640 [Bdellovibrionaceae bacterium]|nr:hypothetical protein [Pseudobdellovibrionaceae bacterium]